MPIGWFIKFQTFQKIIGFIYFTVSWLVFISLHRKILYLDLFSYDLYM